MPSLREAVQENLRASAAGMNGRLGDDRVTKVGGLLPVPAQVDHPQGLDHTPPVLQAAAADMQEGIDAISAVHLNQLYQRYPAAEFHKAVSTVPAERLHEHAARRGLLPHVRGAILAAAAVQKAFDGGKPGAADNPAGSYPDSTPGITIPGHDGGGPANSALQSNWRLHSVPVPRPAGFNDPGTWVLMRVPDGQGPAGEPVKDQWVFQPATGNPVAFPADKAPGGTGDDDRDYNDSARGRFLGQPSPGDLIHFNGPGGSSYQAKTVMVTTGHAIGEFDGQTIVLPFESVRGHSPGGSAGASDGKTPGDLCENDGGPVGVGAAGGGVRKAHVGFDNLVDHLVAHGHDVESAKRIAGAIAYEKYGPGMNRKVKKDLVERAGGVRKYQQSDGSREGASRGAHDPYFGGNASTGDGVKPPLKSPDDGAPLTSYSEGPPYDPDATHNDTGPGNHVQSVGLTPTEYSLIDRVVQHNGPMPTESAALKALRAGNADAEHHEVLRKALRRHAFAVPAAAAPIGGILRKLGGAK